MVIPGLNCFKLADGWSFYSYDYLTDRLTNNGELKQEVLEELEFWTTFETSFRTQILLNGANFILGINSEKKELRLGSVRLFNEIFLLDQIEAPTHGNTELLSQDIYKNFKHHVKEIGQIKLENYPGVSQIVTKKEKLRELSEIETEEVLNKSEEVTKRLLVHLNSYKPVLFEKVSDFALSLTANYALLRVHLLKFLAILPSLDHDVKGTEVKRILLESLKRLIVDSKRANKLKLKGDERALPTLWVVIFYFAYLIFSIFPAGSLAKLIRFKVRFMAKRFIAGENIQLAQNSFKELFQTGRDVTLDQLGELVVSEKEADHYMEEVLKLVNGFSLHIKKGEKNKAGVLRAHVSIKVSALCSDFKPEAFDYTYNLVAPRLKRILLAGKDNEVFINIDAEHYHYRDVVFKIFKKLLLETEELRDYQQTGIVVQAYLRDGADHLREVVALAKERGLTMPIRLVKGAYWDAETVEANAHGYDAPEFLNKEETDINFRQMINEIFASYPHIQLCIASHNFSDHAFAVALRDSQYKDIPEIEHQCLHMTYEALSTAMAKMNWAVRNYVPIGSLIVGMAYLVRRIMENSSQVGVLTIMRSHKKKTKMLSPLEIHQKRLKERDLSYDHSVSKIDGSFLNIPPLKTYIEKQNKSFERELENFKSQLGHDYTNIFDLQGEFIEITSPSDNETVVGKIRFATEEDAKRAIVDSDNEFYNGEWSNLSWVERSAIMIKASEVMHMRRNEFASLIVYESGKAFKEALADVDEAIDFINFYIREQKKIVESGEYRARGPVAVIAPWNFPLAIPCGMAVSALIAGNTVVLKSAEQTPLVVNKLVELLHLAGIPKNAVIHLPGVGETVGQILVESKDISGIIFTGSKPVGVHIAKTAAKRLYKNKNSGKEYPVKVITEMGGKNAVIVTNNAELDETVSGILYSAFAHAGQKCSACSRVIVDNQIKDKLAKRLKEAANDLKVGKATDFSVFVNPLIAKEEKDRLIAQVKEACEEAKNHGGRVHVDRSDDDQLPGNCVGPVVIELPMKRAMLKESYAQRELFAPVVHIIGVDGLDESLAVFNSVEYGLTGGIFSQSQDDIDYCVSRMSAGNIYVNRTITGARVAIEPFGGFKMSGTGPKAGGVDYIRSLQLINQKEDDDVKTVIETGSSYDIVMARPSGIPLVGRIERVVSALDSIINNFGPLFPGIFGKDKERLQSLRNWLINDFQQTVETGRDNRIIPGQLNFSKFDSFKEQSVYVALNERPNIETFINFLMAISCGLGVTVLCTNQKAYIWWSYLIDILVKHRISKRNVECYFVSIEKINSLKNEQIDIVIVDGKGDCVETIFDIFSENIGNGVMTKFITPFESSSVDENFSILHSYVNERSYAINVMRHGAPMELNNL